MLDNFEDFIYNCDSDIVCHKMLLALKKGKTLTEAAREVMDSLDGAFSVTGITATANFSRLKTPME